MQAVRKQSGQWGLLLSAFGFREVCAEVGTLFKNNCQGFCEFKTHIERIM